MGRLVRFGALFVLLLSFSGVSFPDTAGGADSRAKTAASGLYMSGRFLATYGVNYSTVSVSLDAIYNDSSTRTTGTLRLEYWASVTRPERGRGFTGYKLAVFNTLNPLPPRTHYSSIQRSASMQVPPDGTYWLILLLTEYDPANCSAADGYCVQDSFISDNQRTFGNPPTSYTLSVSKSGSGGGTVTSTPGGINCGSTCSASFSSGTVVTLSAAPASGSTFAGWSGACSGLGACSTAMSSGASVTAMFNTSAPPPSTGFVNLSDIWWNPNESGWGLTLADHETQIFGVWYTYDANGAPVWYVIPGGTFSSDFRYFDAEVYRTTGPPLAGPFDPNRVTRALVGTVRMDLAPAGLPEGRLLFTYTIGGITQTKEIQRQPFGNAMPRWGTDFTDIWWNANESGWGLTLAQHGDNVFGVWYTYGADGQPLFLVMPGVTFNGATSFTGTLYTTRGPYFATQPFDPARVVVTAVGTATITFSGRTLTFASTVNGFSQTRTAEQQPFGRSSPKLIFVKKPVRVGKPGETYRHCFCEPDPGGAGLCGFPSQGNPTGGSPPYRFHLGTAGGFPPIGVLLNENGCLTGTPTREGSASFTVCAIDLGGNQDCQEFTMDVRQTEPPAGGAIAGTWFGEWKRRIGGFGDGYYNLTFNLTQNGSSVGGTWSSVLTRCDGICGDRPGEGTSGTFVNGSYSGGVLNLQSGGGTFFNANVSGTLMTGSSGGSFPGTFTLSKQ